MASRIEDIYPLAPLQQGMLHRVLRAPADAAGEFWAQEVGDYTLDPVDADAFRRAWQIVLDRHTALRTGFVWDGVPEPLQVVHAGLPVPFEVLDWSASDDDEQQRRLGALLETDRAEAFDLTAPPLIRVRLVERDRYRCWMVWTFHHLCLDGWSVPIVLDEVQAAYDRPAGGTAWPDLPPARPYRDFITWLAGRDSAGAQRFWREHLDGIEAPTPLPFDRVADGTGPSDTHRLRLPAGVTHDLMEITREARVTLGTIVQAGWAILLGRYGDRRDVVFGLTVSGRPAELPGIESMVGLFINTLPLRTTVDPDESFVDWLYRLQDAQMAVQRYGHTPLAEIQEASAVPPGTPLFDSIITFQNLPEGDLDPDEQGLDGDATVDDSFATPPARCPLMFSVDLDGVLELSVEFSTAAFDRSTVDLLLTRLGNALAAVATNPKAAVRDITAAAHDET